MTLDPTLPLRLLKKKTERFTLTEISYSGIFLYQEIISVINSHH